MNIPEFAFSIGHTYKRRMNLTHHGNVVKPLDRRTSSRLNSPRYKPLHGYVLDNNRYEDCPTHMDLGRWIGNLDKIILQHYGDGLSRKDIQSGVEQATTYINSSHQLVHDACAITSCENPNEVYELRMGSAQLFRSRAAIILLSKVDSRTWLGSDNTCENDMSEHERILAEITYTLPAVQDDVCCARRMECLSEFYRAKINRSAFFNQIVVDAQDAERAEQFVLEVVEEFNNLDAKQKASIDIGLLGHLQCLVAQTCLLANDLLVSTHSTATIMRAHLAIQQATTYVNMAFNRRNYKDNFDRRYHQSLRLLINTLTFDITAAMIPSDAVDNKFANIDWPHDSESDDVDISELSDDSETTDWYTKHSSAELFDFSDAEGTMNVDGDTDVDSHYSFQETVERDELLDAIEGDMVYNYGSDGFAIEDPDFIDGHE
jgi:hypothetical protein